MMTLNSDKTLFLKLFAIGGVVSIAVGNIFLGLATATFLWSIYKKGFRIDCAYSGYYKAIGVFVASMLLSALCSGEIGRGLKVWADFWIWRMMPFVIVMTTIREERTAKNVLYAGYLGFGLATAMVLWQGMHGMSRANGFFGHPMTYAGFSCIFLPLLLVGVLDNKLERRLRIVYALLLACGCLALGFNGTRGAWLGVAVAFMVVVCSFAGIDKRSLISGFVIMAMVGGIFYINPSFHKRAGTITNIKRHTERLLIWESSLKMFKDHPVTGVGLGQWEDNYHKKYISPKAKEPKLGHSHNNYLQMLAENGIVGFAGFMVMFGYILLNNMFSWIKNKNPYALNIVVSTVAIMVQGLTEYNAGNSIVMKMYWLVLACSLVLREWWNSKE